MVSGLGSKMMLLKSPDALALRRAELKGSSDLRELARRLEQLAAPLLDDSIYFPDKKALLSQDGGVCTTDGTRLSFDPLSPWQHRCPKCGTVHEGERHHRAWVWRYHIWLSERAIHLALLGALNGDERLVRRARDIIDLYSGRYRRFPNRDNVLGPSRLFFSTYLESIWLTQLIIAALLLEQAQAGTRWDEFNRVVLESARLIASFDEGWSNRQVWNNTAMIAAGVWLGASGSSSPLATGLDGPHGIRAQLVRAVSNEGLWFEGENYHLFALRGFLLAAELAKTVGLDLYGIDGPAQRLQDMFAAPLLTVLPDLTLPARGDAPYGVSLQQPRFAELWEIAWARTGDVRFGSILTHLYSMDAPEHEDHGLSEIAEQEQNQSPHKLDRRFLGWKALCWMSTDAPAVATGEWQAGSTLLPAAGVAVLRPGPGKYVSVECGGNPGGHGHPDLLHTTLFWDVPILADFGTASYVSPSLFWYRSTLAHNAPGVAGLGQLARTAWCAAIDQRDGWAWCRAVADGVFGEGTRATRTVVVGPSYVIDEVDIVADGSATVDLPIHCVTWNGFPWEKLRAHSQSQVEGIGAAVEIDSKDGYVIESEAMNVVLHRRASEQIFWVQRPGPPDHQFADGAPLPFLVRRNRGSGTWQQCYLLGSVRPTVRHEKGDTLMEYDDGSQDRISLEVDGCRIVDRSGNAINLRGVRGRPLPEDAPKSRQSSITCPTLAEMPTAANWPERVPLRNQFDLGKRQYRRSEQVWGAEGQFVARVAVFVVGSEVCFAADVQKKKVHFRRSRELDPALDNESADVNSDGIQCYIGVGGWSGYLAVPNPDSETVRVNPVRGTMADSRRAKGTWWRAERGYRILVSVDVGRKLVRGEKLPVNLIVNEMYPHRLRRAGQLAFSGGGGWVYLRGDRESPSSAVIAEVS
jgi:hypothetical protein